MFYDRVEIHVKAGDGGHGAVAFRREKYVPYGGPSGGDGGKGGDVVLVVNQHLNTLYHLAHKHEFAAENGVNGRNKDMHGAYGEDLEIPVPPGTLVLDAATGQLLADLKEAEQRYVVARGGKGGRGNKRFASPTDKAPRIAENGDPGEERDIVLELKVLADVGLVGKPNAGKSTFLAATTAARPQIADYPFTTLQPNLGVVALGLDDTFIIADLPGLIEGASEGKGLGLEFLRHIERTRVILHLLDGAAPDPLDDFETINAELAVFGHGLMDKPQLVAINKLDIPEARERYPELEAQIEALGYPVMGISGLTHEGTRALLGRVYQMLETAPPPQLEVETALPVITALPVVEERLIIRREGENVWRIECGKIERAVRRTPINYEEAMLRLHRYLESQGVLKALRKAGVEDGDTVHIGDYELEWQEG